MSVSHQHIWDMRIFIRPRLNLEMFLISSCFSMERETFHTINVANYIWYLLSVSGTDDMSTRGLIRCGKERLQMQNLVAIPWRYKRLRYTVAILVKFKWTIIIWSYCALYRTWLFCMIHYNLLINVSSTLSMDMSCGSEFQWKYYYAL